MSAPRPTTTSYALLGLLAVRPWTGYELTAQARRSLHVVWPRSEANLYAEQKRLVRLGWAEVERERVGRRTRNRYRITDAGRAALDGWLATDPDGPRLEVEGLLRLMFADQTDPARVAAALRATAEHARVERATGVGIVDEYLHDEGPFPARARIVGLIAEFYLDLFDLIERYAERAADEVDGWPGEVPPVDDEYRARLRQLVEPRRGPS